MASDLNFIFRQIYRNLPNKMYDLTQESVMNFSALINSLNQATCFQLFRLRAAIDRILEQPKWSAIVQQKLHLGQHIEYFDLKSNALRSACVLEFRRKHLVVRDELDGKNYLIAYPSVNLEGISVDIEEKSHRGLGINELKVGSMVGFRDKSNRERTGVVKRLNGKTVTLQSENETWRVSYTLLHRVVDGEADLYTDVPYVIENGAFQAVDG